MLPSRSGDYRQVSPYLGSLYPLDPCLSHSFLVPLLYHVQTCYISNLLHLVQTCCIHFALCYYWLPIYLPPPQMLKAENRLNPINFWSLRTKLCLHDFLRVPKIHSFFSGVAFFSIVVDVSFILKARERINSFNFMCVSIFACMYACVLHAHSTEARRGRHIPWNWSYRWLGAPMSVLGTEPWSSARGASALNCWAVSPSHKWISQGHSSVISGVFSHISTALFLFIKTNTENL